MCDNSGDLYLVARTRKLHAVSIPRMRICTCLCTRAHARERLQRSVASYYTRARLKFFLSREEITILDNVDHSFFSSSSSSSSSFLTEEYIFLVSLALVFVKPGEKNSRASRKGTAVRQGGTTRGGICIRIIWMSQNFTSRSPGTWWALDTHGTSLAANRRGRRKKLSAI